ncbi:MAG: kelch repeat-containing protein [Planctomycetota bacterium]|nr:kelch repeat-containing protein [Planctomycetota bacterium]
MLRALALTLSLAATPALAQDAELTWSGGVLGTAVQYQLSGPSGQLFYFLPSVTPGPTPLAFFDPADPRILDVGLELVSFAKLGFLTPTATLNLPMPAAPTFVGLELRAQFVTIDPTFTTPTLVDKVSNVSRFIMGGHGDLVGTLSATIDSRQGHTATLLDDGRVLIIGGDEPDSLDNKTAIATTEIYDPQTQSFTAGPNLTQARSTHTATKLADGRVLVTGGYPTYGPGIASATAEVFDPVSGTFSAVASPSIGRTLHTATLLADGRVLVVGGGTKFDFNDIFGSLATVVETTELYDPVADSWSAGPNLPGPRFAHQASRLGDGRVLISSGVEVGDLFGIPVPGITTDCHRYDPGTGLFMNTAPMPAGRAYHGQITVPSGDAMVMGGATGDFIGLVFTTHTDVFTYNHLANAWTNAGDLSVARAYPNPVDTGSGIAVIAGLKSVDITTGSGTPATEVETSSYTGITWTTAGDQALPRETPRAVVIDGGERVLIVGVGDNGVPAVDDTAEVFIP